MSRLSWSVTATLASLLAGAVLVGCSDDEDDPPETGADGCGLTTQSLLTEVLGDDLDESTGSGPDGLSNAESRTAECTTTVTGDADTFLIVQVYEPPDDAYDQTVDQVRQQRTSCDRPLPLDVDGADGWVCARSFAAGESETELQAVWPSHTMRILLDRSELQDNDPEDVRRVAREAAAELDLA
jgi:hypothetical protein